MDEDLPCPRCGSTLTLSKLRLKRARVKKRLEEERRKRYPLAPPKSSGGGIMLGRTYGYASTSITLDSSYSQDVDNDVVISTPVGTDAESIGTVMINDAVLDVCMECGTFYAANAARLREELEEEIAQMDPLGALAEIRRPEEGVEG